jgi:hypothetical protein
MIFAVAIVLPRSATVSQIKAVEAANVGHPVDLRDDETGAQIVFCDSPDADEHARVHFARPCFGDATVYATLTICMCCGRFADVPQGPADRLRAPQIAARVRDALGSYRALHCAIECSRKFGMSWPIY